MKDITRFINEELKPRYYDYIPQIFPELKFKIRGNKYESQLHADGTAGTGPKRDRCVVTEKYPTLVYDNTRQKATDILTLFQSNNKINEVWEAVDELCRIMGIEPPQYTKEGKDEYLKNEERRKIFEASAERQKKAIFSPEGKDVLKYLHRRGWTNSDIKKAELGYISEAEANEIGAQRSIGTYHTLSIPLRSGSTLYGFKVRTIQKVTEGKNKYTSLYVTQKKYNLFNLTGIQAKEGRIIVVEGELDALKAEVRGLKGVVATGGGYLTSDLLKVAIKRGINRIILLFDKDKSGEGFVRDSIQKAHQMGVSVLVATFPNGESLSDGTPIHDIDEYLQRHTLEELQALIGNAQYGGTYLLYELVEAYSNEGTITHEKEIDLRYKAIDLANDIPNEVERNIILTEYAKLFEVDKNQLFSIEALRAVADQRRAEKNALKQAEETKKALQEAKALSDAGDTQGALQKMGEAYKELRRIETKAKYSHLLALPSEESLMQRIITKQDEIPTLYELSNGKDKEVFTLPSGAITFICAPTSHGKSTFLQNLALQVAEGKGDGSVLYFTFEEEKDAVTIQLMNKYIDTELCRNYSSLESNNMRAIRHFLKTKEDRYISDKAKAVFESRRADFFKEIYTSGKIRIYYEDYDSDELIEAIRNISSQTKVKAVFIDYIQLLSNEDYKRKRMPRTEELKEICKDLKNLCVDTQLPIIVAAQLNREANSPIELHSQKIAEASDLERIANKILCLWNTSFTSQKSKESSKELEAMEAKHNFKLGQGGKIYAKLTKNRGGVVGLEAVFDYNGNTGVVKGNYTPSSIEQEIPFTGGDESCVF